MIADRLDRAALYYNQSPRIKRALEWLQAADLNALPVGRVDLDGDNLFALVQEYDTKHMDDGIWEAHRQYLDVQYVVRGRERFGYVPVEALTVTKPYDAEKDYLNGKAHGSFLYGATGMFFIVWPGDAHMPGMQVDGPEPVRKIVVKARL
jgi:YhcH/YjgK/YiaL family protein